MATFKKTFKDIYTVVLNEQGFKYNSKYGYFFRVINNELIQYITYISLPTFKRGMKCYDIFAGILSIYCESIDQRELRMLGREMYNYSNNINDKNGMYYTEDSIAESIENSVDKVKKYILPMLNEVVDFDSYFKYCKKVVGVDILGHADKFCRDSLSLIIANNHDDFYDFFQEQREKLKVQKRLRNEVVLDDERDSLYDSIVNRIAKKRDSVYQDEKLYVAAIAEAQRRKCANLEYLRNMKVIQ